MIYLLLQPDEYLAAQFVAKLKAALGGEPDPDGRNSIADLNTAELEGAQTSAAELLAQASMMPFLAERRLLVVRNYLTHLHRRMAASDAAKARQSETQGETGRVEQVVGTKKNRGKKSASTEEPREQISAAYLEAIQILAGLGSVPDLCDLVLIEEGDGGKGFSRTSPLWKGFNLPTQEKQPAQKTEGLQALVKSKTVKLEEWYAPENERALGDWIRRHAKEKKKPVAIDGRAVQLLAGFVGPNLRQLDNELDKLAAYAAGRTITDADVRLLVSDASEALIWDLTDGLSQRNGRKALRSLAELRSNDANAIYLLTMIARQYRLIIRVKEAMQQARNENDIGRLLGENAYPVKKAMQQAPAYSFSQLEDILDRLLTADYEMKTGADQDTVLDLLVVELTQKN